MTPKPAPDAGRQPDDPLKPSAALLIKLGSIVVHYQEMNSIKGHFFDKHALQTLEQDEEVKQWMKQMTKLAFLPVKR